MGAPVAASVQERPRTSIPASSQKQPSSSSNLQEDNTVLNDDSKIDPAVNLSSSTEMKTTTISHIQNNVQFSSVNKDIVAKDISECKSVSSEKQINIISTKSTTDPNHTPIKSNTVNPNPINTTLNPSSTNNKKDNQITSKSNSDLPISSSLMKSQPATDKQVRPMSISHNVPKKEISKPPISKPSLNVEKKTTIESGLSSNSSKPVTGQKVHTKSEKKSHYSPYRPRSTNPDSEYFQINSGLFAADGSPLEKRSFPSLGVIARASPIADQGRSFFRSFNPTNPSSPTKSIPSPEMRPRSFNFDHDDVIQPDKSRLPAASSKTTVPVQKQMNFHPSTSSVQKPSTVSPGSAQVTHNGNNTVVNSTTKRSKTQDTGSSSKSNIKDSHGKTSPTVQQVVVHDRDGTQTTHHILIPQNANRNNPDQIQIKSSWDGRQRSTAAQMYKPAADHEKKAVTGSYPSAGSNPKQKRSGSVQHTNVTQQGQTSSRSNSGTHQSVLAASRSQVKTQLKIANTSLKKNVAQQEQRNAQHAVPDQKTIPVLRETHVVNNQAVVAYDQTGNSVIQTSAQSEATRIQTSGHGAQSESKSLDLKDVTVGQAQSNQAMMTNRSETNEESVTKHKSSLQSNNDSKLHLRTFTSSEGATNRKDVDNSDLKTGGSLTITKAREKGKMELLKNPNEFIQSMDANDTRNGLSGESGSDAHDSARTTLPKDAVQNRNASTSHEVSPCTQELDPMTMPKLTPLKRSPSVSAEDLENTASPQSHRAMRDISTNLSQDQNVPNSPGQHVFTEKLSLIETSFSAVSKNLIANPVLQEPPDDEISDPFSLALDDIDNIQIIDNKPNDIPDLHSVPGPSDDAKNPSEDDVIFNPQDSANPGSIVSKRSVAVNGEEEKDTTASQISGLVATNTLGSASGISSIPVGTTHLASDLQNGSCILQKAANASSIPTPAGNAKSKASCAPAIAPAPTTGCNLTITSLNADQVNTQTPIPTKIAPASSDNVKQNNTVIAEEHTKQESETEPPKPLEPAKVPSHLKFEDDDHVTIWNRLEKRKIAGNAAPLGRNLERYLQRHLDCEVYENQDYDPNRSKSSRKRPKVSPKDAKAGDHIVIWNRLEKRKIAGNAAPLAKNLKTYLEKRPYCEVYCDQDKELKNAAAKKNSSREVLVEEPKANEVDCLEEWKNHDDYIDTDQMSHMYKTDYEHTAELFLMDGDENDDVSPIVMTGPTGVEEASSVMIDLDQFLSINQPEEELNSDDEVFGGTLPKLMANFEIPNSS